MRNYWLKQSWVLLCRINGIDLHISKGPYSWRYPVVDLQHLKSQFNLNPILEFAHVAKMELTGGCFGLPSRADISENEFQHIVQSLYVVNETIDGKPSFIPIASYY